MEVCRKPRQVLRLRSEKLGFKPEDIRLLLVTHAHVDHAGATAHFGKLSSAKIAGIDRDFERLFDLRLNWDA
jgi:glyoxylase-like metal-dependent hydrolase (beta-lactamase superfamily II)